MTNISDILGDVSGRLRNHLESSWNFLVKNIYVMAILTMLFVAGSIIYGQMVLIRHFDTNFKRAYKTRKTDMEVLLGKERSRFLLLKAIAEKVGVEPCRINHSQR